MPPILAATVKVTVTEDDKTDAFSIAVVPFTLPLNSAGGQVDITWVLTNRNGPNWNFTDPSYNTSPGIDIHKSFGKFEHKGHLTANTYVWTRKPKQDDNHTYTYSINLVNSNDGRQATLDPFIMNN